MRKLLDDHSVRESLRKQAESVQAAHERDRKQFQEELDDLKAEHHKESQVGTMFLGWQAELLQTNLCQISAKMVLCIHMIGVDRPLKTKQLSCESHSAAVWKR